MSPASTNPKAPARATNILAAHGHSLNDTRRMSDSELLALPGFGKSCLDYVRGLEEGNDDPSTPPGLHTPSGHIPPGLIGWANAPKPKRSWRHLWLKATT